MTRARVHGPLVAITVVLATSASAQPTTMSFIQPPPGWTADSGQAAALAAKTNALSHFGGAPARATAEVFLRAGVPVVLHVSAIAGKVTTARDAAARVEVDSFHAAPRRAQLVSPTITVGRSEEKVDPAARLVRAHLEWSDRDAGTTTHAVLVIAASADSMVAVTGDCVIGTGTPPTELAACTQALATVDPGIPAGQRVALALAPAGTEPAVDDAAAPPTGSGGAFGATGSSTLPPLSGRPPATMDDGSRAPLPPMIIPHQTRRTADRRPVYVGLGIVVLAALFWWNRRRRERFDDNEDNDE